MNTTPQVFYADTDSLIMNKDAFSKLSKIHP